MNPHLSEKIDLLPEEPGVYLMKDAQGRIFYIGKASSLRQRVKSYFSGQDNRFFVHKLPTLLHDIEILLTHNAKEALLLENTLIKKHKPRFNIKLLDDANYLCLKINTQHPYPKIEITRSIKQDGCLYFGPYHQAGSLRKTLALINRYFQLRTCSDRVLQNRTHPCLQYQIHRCPAPCVFDLSNGQYQTHIKHVIQFLSGQTETLLEELRHKMRSQAMALNFEQAARIRDHMAAIEKSTENQNMVSNDHEDRDFVGIDPSGEDVDICLLQYKQGRLYGNIFLHVNKNLFNFEEDIASLLLHHYTHHSNAPQHIHVSQTTPWLTTLAAHLSEHTKKNIQVSSPETMDFKNILLMAKKNAHEEKKKRISLEQRFQKGLENLQNIAHLKKKPCIIDCMDISHHQGTHIVASVIRFKNGVPEKSGYRKFKIKSITQQNDFQSIYETTLRHIKNTLKNQTLPDLLLIDGGKAQLKAAYSALHDLKCTHMDVVSLAKSRSQKGTEERLFTLQSKEPIPLKSTSMEFKIVCNARDEAHRFALQYQKNLRKKNFLL
jgi:excinuclease ABC subunit C